MSKIQVAQEFIEKCLNDDDFIRKNLTACLSTEELYILLNVCITHKEEGIALVDGKMFRKIATGYLLKEFLLRAELEKLYTKEDVKENG